MREMVWRRAPWWLLLASCSPNTDFISPPRDVEFIAWIQLSESGEIIESSGLEPVEEARTLVIDRRLPIVFVGYEAEIGQPDRDEKLRAGRDCAARLPAPDWTSAIHGADPQLLPELSASWVEARCESDPQQPKLRCEPCGRSCTDLLVRHETLPAGPDLTGIVLTDTGDDSLYFLVSGAPDSLAGVTVDRVSGLTMKPEHLPLEGFTMLERGIAFEDGRAFLPLEGGIIREVAVTSATTTERIDTGIRHPELILTGGSGQPIIAFGFEGPAVELVFGATITARPRTELTDEVFAVAVADGRVAAAAEHELVLVDAGGARREIEFPEGLRRLDDDDPRPALAFIGSDLLLGIHHLGVRRWSSETETWSIVDWPLEAEARTIVPFADGVLIGGMSGSGQGLLQLIYRHVTCAAPVRSPVNALIVPPGAPGAQGAPAFGVTSGRDGPQFLEILPPP